LLTIKENKEKKIEGDKQTAKMMGTPNPKYYLCARMIIDDRG
jgi:hypothetical protein